MPQETEEQRIARIKKRREDPDVLDFYLSKGGCKKGEARKLADKLGIDGGSFYDKDYAEGQFKKWQKDHGRRITQADCMGTGVWYMAPPDLYPVPDRWSATDYKSVIKERGWEIDTKGKDKYALHRALKAYCDENKVYVKDSDKPKKASMKQFTTEILKTACQARGLKGSGKKVELEEQFCSAGRGTRTWPRRRRNASSVWTHSRVPTARPIAPGTAGPASTSPHAVRAW